MIYDAIHIGDTFIKNITTKGQSDASVYPYYYHYLRCIMNNNIM